MTEDTTAVLVVGGSLVGLSAAMFLAAHQVPTVLVERHPGSAPHPRAIGYTNRTAELYRSVGLTDLPTVPRRGRTGPRQINVDSLAGTWHDETFWSPKQVAEPVSDVEWSPCGSIGMAQDSLEPRLREHAAKLGADLRYHHELTDWTQDDDGVTAVVEDRETGATTTIRAEYLVAADGHRSPVRESLGIGRTGRGHLHTSRSILFRAPLQDYLRHGFGQFAFDRPDLKGMLTTYGDGRWVLFFDDDDERADAEDFQLAVVRNALGRDDLPIELVTTGRWDVSALVADRFSAGRVFLAGDAAHALPPNRGAYSANTGIADAHNLAWKLAAVRAGQAGPALLASYDAERRPVALLCHEQLFARSDGQDPDNPPPDVPLIDDVAMGYGYLYRSTAVLGAGPDLPPALRPDQWAGQPGTRAPHLWVTRNGQRLSTLDLLGDDWVLLANGPTRSDLTTYRIGVDIVAEDGDLAAAFGLADGGVTLVRPDGVIGWRSVTTPADGAIAEALTTLLGRQTVGIVPPSTVN